jgi:glutathione S-transferase
LRERDLFMEFVDVATARAARVPVLVVAAALPSPWSEAAKGLFHVKGLPVLGVRAMPGDAEIASWTAAHNVPVLMHAGELPRSGWAEILALSERLGGAVSLVPEEPAERARLFGLTHEIAGEDGLGWSSRLLMIHGSLESAGQRGFPLPVANYLAAKYGHAPERIPAARRRIAEVLGLLDATLAQSRAAGHEYFFGAHVSALDIYAATFLTPVVGTTEEDCPAMMARVRPAFAYVKEQIGASVPPALVAHRAMMFRQHLPWPIPL